MHLDAYIRVSKVAGRSGESFISPEVQRQQIERWASAHDHQLIWHEPELDVSGGTMQRPIFAQIMERVRAGQTDGVIVAKLDRFARTLVGALNTLEEFDRHNAALVSVSDSIDLTTPTGRAFLRVLLVFAELERERIADGWGAAVESAIERGLHISPTVPYGYDRVDKRLVPNEDAPAIHEAFIMRGAGHSRTEIARMLDQRVSNGGRWLPGAVERILQNRVYLGEVHRGQLANPDAHEPIVSVAEFQAAAMAPVRSAARSAKTNLLGGIVRCAGCRYLLTPHHATAQADRYKCRRLHKAGKCPAPAAINQDKLDDYVEALWREQMGDPALEVVEDSSELDAVTAALSEAQEELRAFACDTTARSILGETYHEAMRARQEAVREAQTALEQLAAKRPAVGLDVGVYDELPVSDRKRVLASAIDAVFLKPGHSGVPIEERVVLLWRSQGPNDLPRRGLDNGPVRSYDG
jgi:site-specific DNA recombinase